LLPFAVTLVGFTFGALGQEPAPPVADPPASMAAEELAAQLAALVDLPTRRERATAVRALVKAEAATLEQWLDACRAFTPLANDEHDAPGVHSVTVPLHDVAGESMPGEIVVAVPRAYKVGTPAPLLVAMHGTGGAGAHMVGMWQRLCDEHGVLLVCPTEPGPNEGFAATELERDAVLAALRWARRHYDVDEDAVFLTGFSRGGHMTWDLGLRHPDRWAALAPMVGGPRFELARGAANMRYLENVLHVPLFDLQGARDQEGLVWSVREAFRRLEQLKAPRAKLFEFPELGHSVDMDAVDWGTFFELRRDPTPRAVVRRFAREGEGRTAWLECLAAAKTVQEVFRPTLKASENAALDDEGRKRFLIDEALERTARVEALYESPGQFRIDAEGITKLRLLLTREQLGPPSKGGATHEVVVRQGTKAQKLRAKPDVAVLLGDFGERFDRRCMPCAELELVPAR
jgi:predicted esterase